MNTDDDFIDGLKAAIDNLNLTESMAIRLGFTYKDALKLALKSNFNEIFKLK